MVGKRSCIYNHQREAGLNDRISYGKARWPCHPSSSSEYSMPRVSRKAAALAAHVEPAVAFELNFKDLTRQIQRAAGFPEALAALKNGHAATIDGAWGSAAGMVSAALGLHAPTTLVIVLAHISDVDDFCDDIALFAGITPEIFPAWEKLPREQDTSDEVFGKRLRVLNRLAGVTPPRLVVTSIQGSCSQCPGAKCSCGCHGGSVWVTACP